jgi:hypothetical protein
MLFLVALLSMFGCGLGYILYAGLKRRRLMSQNWESILARVEGVDLEGIRRVAECYLNPDGNQLRIETDEMWRLLGGLEGINRLHKNADAMLDLAIYAQRWNDTEGPVIAEMIRRDAIRVRRAVTRFQLTYVLGFGFIKAPLYLQEAAAAYVLMRRRLMGVYVNGHVGLIPRLQAAL